MNAFITSKLKYCTCSALNTRIKKIMNMLFELYTVMSFLLLGICFDPPQKRSAFLHRDLYEHRLREYTNGLVVRFKI